MREAFVGIDADMRAKCMGLIDVFDLDFIMTSEREWGCYATLPGVAIYQLSTRPGIAQVRGSSAWLANASRSELDLGGRKTAASLQTTQSPIRFAVNASARISKLPLPANKLMRE